MKPEKKTEQILIRVTPSEKKQITKNAAAAHMSISAYLARVAEEKKVVALDNLPQLIYSFLQLSIRWRKLRKFLEKSLQRFMTKKSAVSKRLKRKLKN